LEGPQGINLAVDKLNRLGCKGTVIGIPANVADEKGIQQLVQEVKKTESKLDILVANAGATWGGPFDPTPDWASAKVLDLNVRGVFNLIRLSVCHALLVFSTHLHADSRRCWKRQARLQILHV
jgi:NAD(P)-dependent dehydrogenase (short-subunit alcohol dehydrogenase family)